MIWAIQKEKEFKILAQENSQVCVFEEMTNASALSEKKPPLTRTGINILTCMNDHNWGFQTYIQNHYSTISG